MRKKIQQVFKKYKLGNFEKNKKVFQPLLPFQNQAIKNAKYLVPQQYKEINWCKMLDSSGNPSTSIHFLVEEINCLICSS
ncbi:MAG: hypothetical protein A2X78_00080 [Gammaproteobacteria bacterium GWE2_37_16]|nr:MAG: hypothetical protein A2X78_00080 [Gammaproteobacteria bacterium GWE2_37_16]